MNTHLTEEQTRQLREALRGHDLEAILTLALVTGMRRDELLHVKWQDLDLEKRELRVLNSKTKSGDRMIHLPEDITEVLQQHRMCGREARLEAGAAWEDPGPVFSDRTGGFLGPDHLLEGFHEIIERAGLPPLRFHDLRRACWRALREQLRSDREGQKGGMA